MGFKLVSIPVMDLQRQTVQWYTLVWFPPVTKLLSLWQTSATTNANIIPISNLHQAPSPLPLLLPLPANARTNAPTLTAQPLSSETRTLKDTLKSRTNASPSNAEDVGRHSRGETLSSDIGITVKQKPKSVLQRWWGRRVSSQK